MAYNTRILIVDDNKSIHEDFVKVLRTEKNKEHVVIEDLEQSLFGESTHVDPTDADVVQFQYKIDSAYQGEEALEMVKSADIAKAPYALVFMDVRMPPGWDGIETISRIWQLYPYIEMVICTAYSDYNWNEIITKLGHTDKLLFVKKPFDTIVVKQMTMTLIKKWNLSHQAQKYVGTLENEVQDRTTQLTTLLSELEAKNKLLTEAKEQSEQASYLKSAFIATMSKDIRTPLNSIIGMSANLLNTELSQEQTFFAYMVKNSCNRLLTIVNDILDFSKIDAGFFELENIDFDIRQSIEDITALFAETASYKNSSLACFVESNVPRIVHGDPGRIRQIICTFIRNAIRFTIDGEITVTVKHIQQNNNIATLNFEVKDTGVGIDASARENLYNPNLQFDNADRIENRSSIGLGLTLSNQLATLMNAEIGFDSKKGVGSTFWLKINLEVNDTITSTIVNSESSLEGYSLLIVDPNTTTQNIVAQQAKKWGMKVSVAQNKKETFNILSNCKNKCDLPNVIIIDLVIPQIESFELAKNIRKNPDLSDIRIVILTAYGVRGDAYLAKDAGVNAYLSKPLQESYLLLCLQSILQEPASKTLVTRFNLVGKHSHYETKVLVIDNNVVSQKVTQQLLELFGCRVNLASNCNDSIRLANNIDYDLILIDCDLQGTNGFETIREIRSCSKTLYKTIPIIGMTNNRDATTSKLKSAGMNDCITRPITKELIKEKLDQWTSES